MNSQRHSLLVVGEPRKRALLACPAARSRMRTTSGDAGVFTSSWLVVLTPPRTSPSANSGLEYPVLLAGDSSARESLRGGAHAGAV